MLCTYQLPKMKIKLVNLLHILGYPKKLKDRCVIYSHMCAVLNRLTSHPVKGELSFTARYACR